MNNSIVQTLKVNAVDVDGHTALIWAADKGNVEVANHLLSHPNIDPNLQVTLSPAGTKITSLTSISLSGL